MATIDIDFEVYKELTNRRATEATTYNDVIRTILGLESSAVAPPAKSGQDGLNLKGLFLPNGTELRATYKGKTYTAEIDGGVWIGVDGRRRATPSEAACAITHNNVNGWRFWNVRRPSDTSWRTLASLREG